MKLGVVDVYACCDWMSKAVIMMEGGGSEDCKAFLGRGVPYF